MTDITHHFDYRRENIFDAALSTIAACVSSYAAEKTVAVSDDEVAALAHLISDRIDLSQHLALAHQQPEASAAIGRIANAHLDDAQFTKFEALCDALPMAPPIRHPRNYLCVAMMNLLTVCHQRYDHILQWPEVSEASLLPHVTRRLGPCSSIWNDGGISTSYHRGFWLDRPSKEGPALHISQEDGTQIREYWANGLVHREDGPAAIVHDANGNAIRTAYYQNGRLHRDPKDGPACVVARCDKNENLTVWEYASDGKLHREDGPAVILSIPESGQTTMELYYRDNVLHRDDGPAITFYDCEGVKTGEHWYSNGVLHRDADPAMIEYGDGMIIFERHCQNGIFIDTPIEAAGEVANE